MKKLTLLLLLLFVMGRDYQMYKQCDPRWGNDPLGISSETICKSGCLISSVSMALSGVGQVFNPGRIN
jgi:hypothetical protein